MKIEDIQKASDEFAYREYEYNYIDRNALSKGFYHGSKWRINSVWNDERKTPNKSDLTLVEFPDGRVDIVYFHSIKSWKSMVKRNGTIRWAYLEYLKPDKEE